MSHKLTRSFAIIMVLVLIATSVLACTPAPTAAPAAPATKHRPPRLQRNRPKPRLQRKRPRPLSRLAARSW